MYIYEGVEVEILLLPNLGNRWRWSASCSGRFIPGKCPRQPLTRKVGDNHSQSGRFGVEKNLLKLGTLLTVV